MKQYKGKDVIYAGILFSEDSQKLLKETVDALIGKTFPGVITSNVIECQHLTLGFGDNVTDEMLGIVGMPVLSLSPHRILINDFGCGLFFEKRSLKDRGIPWIGESGAMPHVTLYHNSIIPPKFIGLIPVANHTVLVADPTRSLNGTVGVYTADGLWITK